MYKFDCIWWIPFLNDWPDVPWRLLFLLQSAVKHTCSDVHPCSIPKCSLQFLDDLLLLGFREAYLNCVWAWSGSPRLKFSVFCLILFIVCLSFYLNCVPFFWCTTLSSHDWLSLTALSSVLWDYLASPFTSLL